jgi:O-antigen/teichoic acid export membrane protein
MVRRLVGVGFTSVVTAVLAMVAASILAHRLGPTGMGEYQSVIRWTSIWMILGMFGFAHASSYFAARSSDERVRELVGNSVITTIPQSAFLLVFGYLIAPYLFRTPGALFGSRIFLLYIPINLLLTNFAHIVIGRLDTRAFNLFRLLQAGVFVAVAVPVVLVVPTSATPLGSTVIAAGVALVFLILLLQNRKQLRLKGDAKLWKLTAAYGMKAYPGVISRELNLYVDQLLISLLLLTRFLGLYAAAASAASVLSVASSAFFYLAQPETQNAAPGTAAESSARMSRMTVAFLAPLAIVLSLIMPIALPIVYGGAFAPAVAAAQILCFAGALDGVIAVLAGSALGSGRPILSTIAQTGAMTVKIVLVVTLLPRFGISGAAGASLVAYLGCTGFLVMAMSRRTGISPLRYLIPDRGDLRLILDTLRHMPLRGARGGQPDPVKRP